MPALNNPRREAFAQGLAEGLSRLEAYGISGFKAKPRNAPTVAKKMAARSDVIARVDELRQDMNWGATPDLTRVINELAWLARKARTMDTPAALAAARGILAEIASLKGKLGETDAGIVEASPSEPPMSNAEWVATYAPKE